MRSEVLLRPAAVKLPLGTWEYLKQKYVQPGRFREPSQISQSGMTSAMSTFIKAGTASSEECEEEGLDPYRWRSSIAALDTEIAWQRSQADRMRPLFLGRHSEKS